MTGRATASGGGSGGSRGCGGLRGSGRGRVHLDGLRRGCAAADAGGANAEYGVGSASCPARRGADRPTRRRRRARGAGHAPARANGSGARRRARARRGQFEAPRAEPRGGCGELGAAARAAACDVRAATGLGERSAAELAELRRRRRRRRGTDCTRAAPSGRAPLPRSTTRIGAIGAAVAGPARARAAPHAAGSAPRERSPRTTLVTARSARPGPAQARQAPPRPCAGRRRSPSPRCRWARLRIERAAARGAVAERRTVRRRADPTAALAPVAPPSRLSWRPAMGGLPLRACWICDCAAAVIGEGPAPSDVARREGTGEALPAARTLRPGRSAAWEERSEARAFGRTPGRRSGAAGSRVRTSRRS